MAIEEMEVLVQYPHLKELQLPWDLLYILYA